MDRKLLGKINLKLLLSSLRIMLFSYNFLLLSIFILFLFSEQQQQQKWKWKNTRIEAVLSLILCHKTINDTCCCWMRKTYLQFFNSNKKVSFAILKSFSTEENKRRKLHQFIFFFLFSSGLSLRFLVWWNIRWNWNLILFSIELKLKSS